MHLISARTVRLLIVIGRLEPQKGHRYLLEAMPLIRQHFPTVQLVCLGEGSLRAELDQMVRRLQLEGFVRFLGYEPDVSRWFARRRPEHFAIALRGPAHGRAGVSCRGVSHRRHRR